MAALTTRERDRFPEVALTVLFLLFFIIACLLPSTPATGALSFAALLLYGVYLLLHDLSFFIKYMAMYFFVFANVAGVLSCEFADIYLSEIRKFSGFVGSLPLICMASWVFLAAIRVFDKYTALGKLSLALQPLSEQAKPLINWVVWGGIIIQSVLFVHVAAHPAFVTNLDRFQYNQAYLGGIWTGLQALLLYVVPVASLALVNRHNIRPSAFFLCIYLLYAFWVGNKFGIFFTAMYCVLLVYYPKIANLDRRAMSRVAKIVIGVLIGLFLIMSASQMLVHNQGIVDYGNYLASRMAQQGQIWWRLYDICAGSAVHPEEFGNQIAASLNTVITGQQDYDAGIYKAMQMVNPIDFAYKVSTGSVYTESGYALAFYYFGVWGIVGFSIVFAGLFFLAINWFVVAITRGWVVEAAILFRLYNKLATARSMLLLDDLISLETLISLSVLLILLIARSKGAFRAQPARSATMTRSISTLRETGSVR